METAALKSFATRARTELTGEVTARIKGVLENPQLRQEQPKAVTALERAIAAAGNTSVVAEKVAYTWFNRIIALRYMDANGYTGAGVVSPGPGQAGGPPEILADANRGTINPEIVSTGVAAQVTGLLNGTRSSQDAFGEAYTLLLEEYCRYWNRSMPFMFEAEGDYTELLMPGNLLSPDSVMARAADVLTEEVCRDVEVIGWLYQFYISERKEEVFAGFKKNKKAGAAEIPAATQLFTPHWIVRYLVENSLGRLWLLNRPSSALADQMEYYIAPVDEETDFLKINGPEELKIIDPACGSGHMLTYAFDLLYAIYEEEGYAPSDIPALILSKNLYGTEIDPRAGALAAFALTMKARHRQRTFLTKNVEPNICVLAPVSFTPAELDVLVTSGGDRHAEEMFWNQFEHADTLGSLIQPNETLIGPLRDHLKALQQDAIDLFVGALLDRAIRVLDQADYLTSRYHVAVANPPYMGNKSMGGLLQDFVKQNYPTTYADLYSTFIERSISIVTANGLVAMITMQSWMFLSAYRKLRLSMIANNGLLTMAHFGTNAFDSIGGAVVSTTAFTIKKDRGERRILGTYVRLTSGTNEFEKSSHLRKAIKGTAPELISMVDAARFVALPGAQFAYWLSENALAAYRSFDTFGQHSYGQPGLQTSDNVRFTRYWYEVSNDNANYTSRSSEDAVASGAKWFPLVRGGEYRRWYGNLESVVNWRNNGEEIKSSIARKYPYLKGQTDYVVKDRGYFFKKSITYNRISSDRLAVRYTDPGTIFDVAGSAVFPHTDWWGSLGFLGSSTADYFMRAQNPTFTIQSGDVAALPFPAEAISNLGERLGSHVQRAIEISRLDWNARETSWEFSSLEILNGYDSRGLLSHSSKTLIDSNIRDREELAETESAINYLVASAFGLETEVKIDVAKEDVTLFHRTAASVARDIASYAVGCMFGRYSLDVPGLILANQGDTLKDYLAKVPTPSFMPDADNVIPIVDGDWFEDDIVSRFRQFLRVAFGEEHFEENLRFVTESLGVKDLRDYFVKSFYKDHVQRYKKRPIYWLFSSPKGSFNALIYMHRYDSQTASRVLNEYLHEFKAKLEASREHHDRLALSAGSAREKSAALKEVDRLRKILFELEEYEHDVLYPVAIHEIHLDLNDGVKVNYAKLGAALKKIPGLEATDE